MDVQCPRCGGYRVAQVLSDFEYVVFVLLLILTGGLGWLPLILLFYRQPRQGAPLKCHLCGHHWNHDPGALLIEPDAALMQKERYLQEHLRRRIRW